MKHLMALPFQQVALAGRLIRALCSAPAKLAPLRRSRCVSTYAWHIARYPSAERNAVDLLERMLVFDPNERITTEDALAYVEQSTHKPSPACKQWRGCVCGLGARVCVCVGVGGWMLCGGVVWVRVRVRVLPWCVCVCLCEQLGVGGLV